MFFFNAPSFHRQGHVERLGVKPLLFKISFTPGRLSLPLFSSTQGQLFRNTVCMCVRLNKKEKYVQNSETNSNSNSMRE